MLEINLLGYGAGNCFYEKQVAQFLNEKFFIRVNIFAYEPYIDPIIKQNLNDITFIDHDNLLSNPNLKFDIILARWVLHHVEEKARWKPLSVFLNACKRRSLIIFHEEGDCFELKNSLPSLLYRFFLSCIDVIINYGLRPEWFLSSTPDIGKNFYIDYLDENDILNIEKLFKFKYRRTIHPISHNNSYGQYLINYEVINN